MFYPFCRVTLLIFVTVLSSCKTIDEGEIDYVRTVNGLTTASTNKEVCSMKLHQQSLQTRDGYTRNCYESLHRKYADVPAIRKGESISVHLMQAFIQDATESRSLMERVRAVASNAEVTVIANVCEQGIKGCGLEFGPSTDTKGRVIYFSNGVKAKQYLNFSYLPVYGPIEYQGGPLIVQLAIIELDNMTEEQKALLTKLAEIGKQKFAPASDVLSVLDGLGSSLLSGGGDDVVFKYTFTMMPDGADKGYPFPTISAGNFAFVKKKTVELEQEKQIWDELKFDSLTGRLVKGCSQDDVKLSKHQVIEKNKVKKQYDYNPCSEPSDQYLYGYKDYRDNTYMTLQVQSGFSPRTLDKSQTLNELLSELSGSEPKSAEQLEGDISKLTQAYYQATALDNLRAPISSMAQYSKTGEQLLLDQFEIAAHIFENTLKQAINDTKCDNSKHKCPKSLTAEQILKVISHGRNLLTQLGYRGDLDEALPLDFSLLKYESKATATNIASVFIKAYKQFEQAQRYNWFRSSLVNITRELLKLTHLLTREESLLPSSVENVKVKLDKLIESIRQEQERFILTQCNVKPDKDVCQRIMSSVQLSIINQDMFDFLQVLPVSGTKCHDKGIKLARQRLASFIIGSHISLSESQRSSAKEVIKKVIESEKASLTEQQVGFNRATLIELFDERLELAVNKQQLLTLTKHNLLPLSVIDTDNISKYVGCLMSGK
ncbi:hypothetical protein PSECIP111854_00071 [Pseudoalteromonas sp. CIP111854]|uniref:Uncharacterized protein n=1 Tax=Pseudoalteromonas holothuriae TaxID=2963714 RepID=A0A9W4VUN2_9GAMM|nr:hypothetical protein [Pseudoalteromonas sp. CIP111854]CAH9049438.1 hypothetical protein PSECIP111854_00071 [Pseudoalteromonas sp. CIP111854]